MSNPEISKWVIEHHRDSVKKLHALDYQSSRGRVVRVYEPIDSALVLGSTQSVDLVKAEQAKSLHINVIKRQSGGGAVYVASNSILWVDIEIPKSDELFENDVSHSFNWLGHVWANAFAYLEIGPLSMHEGDATRDEISRLICFAGRGPGEVFIDGRKAVGLCQRRTRSGSLFQCAMALEWDPFIYESLLNVKAESLEGIVYSLSVERSLLLEAFVGSLERYDPNH